MKLTKRKGFNFFRSYYDVYNELETVEDKIGFIDALLDRQFLGIKPTELKGMVKFAYISQTNSIDSQVKGYEDKTKTKLNPTEGGTQGGEQGGYNTPTLQVEEKVEVEVEVEVEDNNTKKFNFRKSLIDLGFNKELVSDWLKVRRTKKATNTVTALKSFLKEVEKSKLSPDQILTICIEKDWKGFKNEWLKNINNEGINNKTTTRTTATASFSEAIEYLAKIGETRAGG